MSTRGKRIVTYKRDPERQKRQRIKKALGVSTWDDVARLAATPAISLRDRPSLQVAQFTWTQNKVPVVFNPGGTVYLMTMYPFGGSEAQRHANTTMTYKMSIGQEVQLDKAFYASCGMYYMQWWLVYDKASTGAPSHGVVCNVYGRFRYYTWYTPWDDHLLAIFGVDCEILLAADQLLPAWEEFEWDVVGDVVCGMRVVRGEVNPTVPVVVPPELSCPGCLCCACGSAYVEGPGSADGSLTGFLARSSSHSRSCLAVS
nr:coat protein [Ipomoea batatas]